MSKFPKRIAVAAVAAAVVFTGAGIVMAYRAFTAPDVLTVTPQPSVESSDTPEPTASTAGTTSSPKPTTSPSPSTKPKTSVSPSTSASPGPWRITTVSLPKGSPNCNGSSVVGYYLPSLTLTASSAAGGTFSANAEINTGQVIRTPLAYAFPSGQTTYTRMTGVGSDDPLMYLDIINMSPRPSSVRIHVTSPNDIYSNWVSIPSSC
jgi:hypothetical protein